MRFLFLPLLLTLALAAQDSAEQTVLKTAQELCQAQLKKDKAALERLLGDDIVYSHSNAMRETKAEHIAATLDPGRRYSRIELADTKVRVYGNAAVLTAKAIFSVDQGGKVTDNHLSMMQTWVKKGKNWQLVGRWTTRLPQ